MMMDSVCTTFGLEYSSALSTRPDDFMVGDGVSVMVRV